MNQQSLGGFGVAASTLLLMMLFKALGFERFDASVSFIRFYLVEDSAKKSHSLFEEKLDTLGLPRVPTPQSS
jgi:hypothetical protein